MALNLEKLVFEVETGQLVDAAKKLEALGTALNKVNKPASEAAIKTEKLAQAQAKTAESVAKAEAATSKAAIAAERLNKAQDTGNETTKRSLSIQERQATILEFMNQGYSKGQSSVLAYAKAAGEATDEIAKILDMQRKIAGGDPFDKSLSGIKSLKNELEVLTQVEKLYAQGADLTTKQVRNLSLDRERLVQKMRQEGASIIEIQTALKNLNAEYISVANQVNKVAGAEAAMIKNRKDAAAATQYLADADARLAAALSETNKTLDKGATDALVKYEKALKTSGMSADEAAAKLAVAKKQFEGIADKKQADRLQYLARAISVQMGDVGISLASGMNPLLVMIQQGDQIRGAIQQAGASGKELEKAMSNAAGQIATSFALTGAAIGGFFISAIKGAGKSITKLAMDITGTEQVLEKLRYNIALLDGSDGKLMKMFKGAAAGIEILTGVIITGAVVALIALGVAIKEVIAQESALSKAVNMSGGSLGLTTDRALTLAEAYSGTKKNIGDYVGAITEAAKAGNIGSDSLKLVTTSAVNLQKAAGISVEATVKEFSKLADKPTTALIDLAKSTGLVNPKVLELVDNLERSGKKSEAAALATKEYADAVNKMANSIKDDMGYLESFFKGIGSAASSMWNAILNVGRKDTLASQLEAAKEELKSLQSGGGGLFGTGLMTEQYRKNSIQVQEAIVASIEKEIESQKKLGEAKKKASDDAKKFEEDRAKRQGMGGFSLPADLGLEDLKKQHDSTIKLIDAESNKLMAQSKTRYALGLSDMGDFLSEELSLISDQNKQKLDENDKYLLKLEEARKTQEKKIRDEGARAAKAVAFDKQEAEAKKMQDALEKLNDTYKNLAEGIKTANEVIKDKTIEQQTKALDNLGQYTKKVVEGSKDFIRTQDDIIEKRQMQIALDARLVNLYGAEAARVKAQVTLEQSHIDKLSELEDAALKASVAFSKIKLSGLDVNDPKYKLAENAVTAAQTALDSARTKSKTAIVQAGIDAEVAYYKQEYERITNSITDAIVTALFEGGKAGSKKIRDLIVAELKKPITIAVKAVVDVASAATNKLVNTGLNYLGSIAMGSSTVGQTLTAFGQGLAEGAGFSTTAISSIEAGSTAASAFNAGASAMEMAAAAGPYVLAAVAALNALGVFKSTKTVGGGLTGTLGAGDVQSYDLTRTSGTLFNGPSYNVANRRVSPESAALESAFTAIKTSTAAMAESLGLSTEKVKNFTMAVGDIKVHPDIDQLGLVLDGLSNEDKVKKIEELLTKSSNAMAELVLGAGATAEQLVQVYNNVMGERYGLETQLLELQGDTTELRKRERAQLHESNRALYDQIKALEDLKNTTIEVKDGVIEVAEGVKIAVEDISDAMKSLLRERADLEIQLLQVQGKSGEAATAMRNLAIQGFTEAEIAAYDYNQSLKTQIKSYNDAQEAAAKAQADSKAAAQALVEITRSATDAAFNALKTYIESSITEFEKTYTITDIALSRVEKAIEAEKSLAQVRLDSALDQKEAIQAVVDVLTNSIDQLRGSTSLLSARGLITSAISSGNLPEASKLSEAIATVRDSIETTSYATKVDQIKASLRFANELEALQAIAEPQLSAAEQTVVLAQKQIDVLDSQLKNAQLQVDILRNVDTTILSVDSAIAQLQTAVGAEVLAREQIDALKAQLTIATEQYNELRNLNTNITSLAAAISGFQSAIVSEQSAATAASVPVTSASNNQNLAISAGDSPAVAAAKVLYQSATGGVDTNLYNQYVTGAAGQEAKNAFAGDPENLRRIYGFADGGMYPGGLALVGEEGPELINFNQGGQVYNAGQTSSLLNSGDAVEELKAVRQEIVMLRAEVRADVSYNAKTARLLTRVTPDGDTLAVSAAIDGGVL